MIRRQRAMKTGRLCLPSLSILLLCAALLARFRAVPAALVLLIFFGIGAAPLIAQEDEYLATNREHQIKAAYIYQFGRYVHWPDATFPTPQSPLVIGVMEDDPIVPHLERIAVGRKVQERPIRIRKFSSPSDIQPCHIVFLSPSVPLKDQVEVLRKMKRQGVLTVGDTPGFTERGGTIQFVIKDNNVIVHIARKTAEQEGLSISAKLLQVAHIVD